VSPPTRSWTTPSAPDQPPPDPASHEAFDQAVARAVADPDVLGAILVGSRVLGPPFLRDGSDWDLRLIAADAAIEVASARHGTPHGSPVEVFVMRRSSFEGLARRDSPAAWDRPSYAFARLVADKLDGGIAATLAAVSHLAPGEARETAADALDDYVNSYYRALKNAAIGMGIGAHLDAAESIAPLLTFLFALRGRVRPFNRHLAWALEREPLGAGWLATAPLLERVETIVATGDLALQAALFRDVESLARAEGHGEVIDGWEPDVGWLRGEAQPAD